MTTSTITNVQALTMLVDHAKATGFDDPAVLDKVVKHIAQLSKPKTKSTAPSKTQLLNNNLKVEVLGLFKDGDILTTSQVVEKLGSPYITTTQKATVICGLLVSDGKLARLCVKGRVMWGLPRE